MEEDTRNLVDDGNFKGRWRLHSDKHLGPNTLVLELEGTFTDIPDLKFQVNRILENDETTKYTPKLPDIVDELKQEIYATSKQVQIINNVKYPRTWDLAKEGSKSWTSISY